LRIANIDENYCLDWGLRCGILTKQLRLWGLGI